MSLELTFFFFSELTQLTIENLRFIESAKVAPTTQPQHSRKKKLSAELSDIETEATPKKIDKHLKSTQLQPVKLTQLLKFRPSSGEMLIKTLSKTSHTFCIMMRSDDEPM